MEVADHQRRLGRGGRHDQRIGAHRDEVAMGEVDQFEHPEQQPDTKCGKGIEAAEAECIHQNLKCERHQIITSPS